ncbi:sensor histidine kinase [Aureimonas pseudogalii]|uniref:histidine kinase n=1 Tax=Aureimonas pseudogalii TaxID=1744844 RepID=A0A7W6EF08_9HYPH|nr:ATP-binding protein [Aureimonas pseudogalii]MBB3998202.1 two-component system cell cycle sensor histidine kinase PleC [Aureimonas pseudogalii]
MSIVAPPSYDTTPARSKRPARDVELARTLKAARDQLTSASGLPPRIEFELLDHHAAQGRRFLPALAALAAIGAGLLAPGAPLLGAGWFLLALAGSAVAAILAMRFERAPRRVFEVRRWQTKVQAGAVAVGLPWALYVLLPGCDEACGPIASDVARFALPMAAIAATSLCTFALGGVVLLTFSPLAVALAYRLAATPGTLASVLDALLFVAIPFFAVVSIRLRAGLVERFRHRAERDQFVAEIETARLYSDDARRRAEEANLAKSQFLATMSHELRTPLNAILGFSEVISNEILGPVGNATYKEYVDDIHTSGQHLLDLINEILDLSRVEAGRYTLNEEAVDLVSIARDSRHFVQMKADAKAITIVEKYEPGLPQLWGDPRSLRQVVLNLLSNAVKFTPERGQIVLRVGWTAGGGQYVSVRDNGPGIPADEIPIVLSSFGQGSSAIKSAEQGTGLGLPIVQALVKLHDGEFELHSKLRQGTEAIAIFPHARVLEVMPAMPEFA